MQHLGKRNKTGLFGGTFDPIHYGHVELARQLRDRLSLDEVWFLVTPQNPWKQNTNLSDDNMRLEMVRLALEDNPELIASDYEFHLEKPSYSYQTLRHLREDFPDRDFTLLIGADNWAAFDKWSHPEEILSHHAIAVFPREGYPLPSPTPPSNIKGITIVDAPLLPISSTEIRRRIKSGDTIANLVSPAVEEYIKKHSLYSSDRTSSAV